MGSERKVLHTMSYERPTWNLTNSRVAVGPRGLLACALVVAIIMLLLASTAGGIAQWSRALRVNLCFVDLVRAAVTDRSDADRMGSCFQQPTAGDPQAIFGWTHRHIVKGDVEPVLQVLSEYSYQDLGMRTQVTWIALADAFLEQGDVQRMAWVWRRAGLWNQPDATRAAFNLAKRAIAEGRDQEGEMLYRLAAGMDFVDSQQRFYLARVLFEQYGDRAGAAEQLLRVASAETLTFQETMQLAALLREIGQYQEARRWALQAGIMDPGSLWPRLEMVTIAMSEGNYREAEQIALEVLATNRDNASAYAVLGWAYGAQGRFDEAVTAVGKAISLQPDAHWPYALLAWFLTSQEDYAEAEIAIRQAIALAPGEVSYVIRLADLLALQNRREESLALYRQAWEMKGAERFDAHIQAQIERLTQ